MFFKDQGQPVLIANSRKILGAQGRLATLLLHDKHCYTSKAMHFATCCEVTAFVRNAISNQTVW